MIEFQGTVRLIGERTIVEFPADASAELPSRGQVAAEVVVNGAGRRAIVEPDGLRGHWLSLDDLDLDEGAAVRVQVAPTKDWPEPEIPADLHDALQGAPEILGVWADITPMARWEWVRWIGATRNPDTRAKRVRVAVDKMRHGKRRPCCFDLSSCTDPDLSRSGRLIQA